MTIQEETMLQEILSTDMQKNSNNLATVSNSTSSQRENISLSNIRLIITHIENLNFKSYAGKQVLGPFHKVYSCF